jgi:outer membrane protein OmpA-like peptidoglycan-associated protein
MPVRSSTHGRSMVRWPAVLISALVLALIAGLGALVSCDSRPSCSKIKTTPRGTERPFDIAYDGTADASVSKLPSALMAKIEAAARRPDVFAVAAVQGDAATNFWHLEGYMARSVSDDGDRKTRLAKDVAKCVADAVYATRPQVPNTDVLAALQRVGEDIARRPRPATVAVVSNGLNNTPLLDVRDMIGKGTSADEIVASVRAHNELPALSGANVTFYGLGYPRSGLPQLPKSYREWLKDLWKKICWAAGAASCVVEDAPTGQAPSPGVSDAPFPKLTDSITAPTTTSPLIPDTLFSPGSAYLYHDADLILQPVVRWLRIAGRSVRVVGHTASWGSTAYRRRLSEERAGAVAARLTALGADPAQITAAGVGSTEPLVRDVDARTKKLIPEAAIRNRRVEIMLRDKQ